MPEIPAGQPSEDPEPGGKGQSLTTCRETWLPGGLATENDTTVTCCPGLSSQGNDIIPMLCVSGYRAPILALENNSKADTLNPSSLLAAYI